MAISQVRDPYVLFGVGVVCLLLRQTTEVLRWLSFSL
jgi:hypothetical protein